MSTSNLFRRSRFRGLSTRRGQGKHQLASLSRVSKRLLRLEPLESRVLLEVSPYPLFPGEVFSVGGNPRCVATGDFNRDGILDLVTANNDSDTVSVLLGRGDGTFEARTDYGVGDHPESVTVGDFNGDGLLDLVTANGNFDTVSVLLGRGDGTFGARTDYGLGGSPSSVAVGDFNGDGFLDLVVGNWWHDTVSVLLNRTATMRYGSIDSPVRSGQILVGDTLRFLSHGVPGEYRWDFGDGRSSSVEDPGLVRFPHRAKGLWCLMWLTPRGVIADCRTPGH